MPYRRPVNLVLSGFIVVGILALLFAALVTISHTDSGRDAAQAASANTRIAQQNSDRTECIRAISNELDHAHWALIGQAFNTTSREQAHLIGQKLSGLPLVVDVAERGGSILKTHFDRCPPAPTKETP